MHVNSLIDLDQNFNLVASIKYQSDLDADRYISETSARISTNFKWTTFTYMNILNMRTKILCHRNENEINQKFVCLKVASINISYSTVPGCVPFPMAPLLFVSLNRNRLLFKKITFKIINEYHRFQ
jgi:hypothetical protein